MLISENVTTYTPLGTTWIEGHSPDRAARERGRAYVRVLKTLLNFHENDKNLTWTNMSLLSLSI